MIFTVIVCVLTLSQVVGAFWCLWAVGAYAAFLLPAVVCVAPGARTVGALSFADGAAASEAGAATCVLDESAGMAAK